jgi:hypothetical protein
MSVLEGIRDKLAADGEIVRLLATNEFGDPSIYSYWAGEGKRPYINMRVSTGPTGGHWGMMTGPVNLDIFTSGPGVWDAEEIRDNVIRVLDRTTIADEGILYRLYLTNDSSVPEPEPEVAHWNVELEARFWRQQFVEDLVARGP